MSGAAWPLYCADGYADHEEDHGDKARKLRVCRTARVAPACKSAHIRPKRARSLQCASASLGPYIKCESFVEERRTRQW